MIKSLAKRVATPVIRMSQWKPRTAFCAEISKFLDRDVCLVGWAQAVRKINSSKCFLVIRDHTGTVQAIASSNYAVPVESVIAIEGRITRRPEKDIRDGNDLEMIAQDVHLISKCDPLPFQNSALEEIRLKYRYLDLRSQKLQINIRSRSKALRIVRNTLESENYIEIETPTLFKCTPEGAREFIVPTRQKGQFYALSQSPQQHKQLLMASGFERYYQIARCYRDEDQRADRQPEFTQIDIEASFVTQYCIMNTTQRIMKNLFKEFTDFEPKFPVISYRDAIHLYGTDKPDIRLRYPLEYAKTCFFRVPIADFQTNVHKFLVDFKKILPKTEDCFLRDEYFFCVGESIAATRSLFIQSAIESEAIKGPKFGFVWVYDFPLFQPSKNSWKSTHHPFTAPHFDDVELFMESIEDIRAQHYDLVLNGCEVAGGSIRIHDHVLQRRILEIIELDPKHFCHLLDALRFGCPPHGGIAVGFDRLLSIIFGTKSIRDVIAFPKSNGRELMVDSPTKVNSLHLKELGIKVL